MYVWYSDTGLQPSETCQSLRNQYMLHKFLKEQLNRFKTKNTPLFTHFKQTMHVNAFCFESKLHKTTEVSHEIK